jgi:hypothetical protein
MSSPKESSISVTTSGASLPEPLTVPVSVAAHLLSLSEYSIRLLCRKDQLKYKKISQTKWLITTASIRKFAGAA